MGANIIVVGLCGPHLSHPQFLAALPVAHQDHSGKSICVARTELPQQINWLNPSPTVPVCLLKVTLQTYFFVADIIRIHFPTLQRNQKNKNVPGLGMEHMEPVNFQVGCDGKF